jgi:hypothetical protein
MIKDPDAILWVVGVFVFGVTFLPIIWGFRYHRRKLEHAERMRALEMGRPLPGEAQCHQQPLSSSYSAITIGAGVPIGVFGCAWLASMTVGYQETIWITSALVSMTAVICGTILAKHSIGSEVPAAKAHVEEDAYDVVASRG